MSLENNQPDLLKEVLLAQSLKPSRTENDLERFEVAKFKSKSCDVDGDGFVSLRCKKSRHFFKFSSQSFNNCDCDVSKGKEESQKKKNHRRLARSCISQ